MNSMDNYVIPTGCLDEVFHSNGEIKAPYENILSFFSNLDQAQFQQLNESAKLSFLNQGITYQVYSNNRKTENIFPFDLLPRIITPTDWLTIEKGVLQRNLALNLFLKDVYGKGKVFKDKIVPKEMIYSSAHFCPLMKDFTPKGDIYCHISGTDIIKHTDNKFYVLEDNLRSPSGVSYVLSNRDALKKVVGNIFKSNRINTVDEYPTELLNTLQSVAPNGDDEEANCVLLTPGMYNSAYFEHIFLAQQMGIELVEGRDLFVDKGYVYMKTTRGAQRVDVIYRRIDDDFLDPAVFNKDSILGVRGLMEAYLKGNVTLVNAPGTGVADDKAIYHYVPKLIRYYLNEEPIIENVHTYICEDPTDLKYVLENIKDLVIKPVDMSGGYGISIGNRLSSKEIEEVKAQIKAAPRQYVAQPIMSLSLHSTYIEEVGQFEPRHIDLRTFTLMGKNTNFVLKGGLSRVALTKGSLIVNSSQGGGSKDTWVIEN